MIDFQILGHVSGGEVAVWARPTDDGGFVIAGDRRICSTLRSALDFAEERMRTLFDNADADRNRWGLRVEINGVRYDFGDWSHYPVTVRNVVEVEDPDVRAACQRYEGGKTPRTALHLARVLVEHHERELGR